MKIERTFGYVEPKSAREILKSIGFCKIELRKMNDKECEEELKQILEVTSDE